MFTKLTSIASIETGDNQEYITHYFYSKKYKILLPIITEHQYKDEDLLGLFNRVLSLFNIHISRILIYHFDGNSFYSCLVIKKTPKTFEMKVELSKILWIHKILKCPIFIKKDLLETQGIKVTRNMILKALDEDHYYI